MHNFPSSDSLSPGACFLGLGPLECILGNAASLHFQDTHLHLAYRLEDRKERG